MLNIWATLLFKTLCGFKFKYSQTCINLSRHPQRMLQYSINVGVRLKQVSCIEQILFCIKYQCPMLCPNASKACTKISAACTKISTSLDCYIDRVESSSGRMSNDFPGHPLNSFHFFKRMGLWGGLYTNIRSFFLLSKHCQGHLKG